MTDNMQTTKQLYKHADTCEVFAIESLWRGGIVGSTPPLTEPLKELDEYECTPDRNDWLQAQSDKLILI